MAKFSQPSTSKIFNLIDVGDDTFLIGCFDSGDIWGYIYKLIWRGSWNQVEDLGAFQNLELAKDHLKRYRNEIIDKEFEKIVLTNK